MNRIWNSFSASLLLMPFLLAFSGKVFGQTVTIDLALPAEICAGANLEVPFTVSGSYNPGNVFILELSDSAGNFAFQTTLGTIPATSSDLFGVTIPNTTFAGSTYYLRIQASSPSNVSQIFGPVRIKNPFANLVPVSNGLVAYYSMDGTGEDRSGFENHAYIAGGVTPAPNRFGTPGRALEFNGSDGFLIAANSPSLESPQQEISVAAWLYIRGYQGNWSGVMAKTSSSNVGQYNIELNRNGDYRLHFKGNRTSADNSWQLNRWTFITITATQDSMFYYIDGQRIANRGYSQGNSIDTMRLEIGRHRPGGTEYFNGFMDEFRIYNRKITDQEVLALYNENPITASSPVCEGGQASLTFPSIDGATFQWTGPNNFSSTSNPVVFSNLSAANNGTYTVIATAEGCVSEPQQIEFQVNSVAPLPPFNRNLGVCAGDSANLTLPEVDGLAYSWLNPNQFSFPNRPVTRALLGDTTGTVVLPFMLTNLQSGCQRRDSVLVSITPRPNAAFSGVSPQVCVSTNPITLLPLIPGGIFSGVGVTGNLFTPIIPGIVNITYSLTVGGCSATQSLEINVVDSPDPRFTAGNLSEVCLNSGPITLVAASTGGVFSGTGVSGNIFTPSVTDTITIVHRIFLSGCTDSSQVTIIVKPLPDAVFAGINPFTCLGTSSTLVPNTTGGVFSGLGVSGNTFAPTDTGTFTLQYKIEANGCSDSTSLATQVILTPNSTFSFSSGDSVCQGSDDVILIPLQTGGIFSGNQVLAGRFTPSSVGSFEVKYVLNLGSCTDSSTRIIVVKAKPDANFSGLADSLCLNSAVITLIPQTPGGNFVGELVDGITFNPTTIGISTVLYSLTIAGCEASEIKTTTVVSLPNAGFAGLPEVICANNTAIDLVPVLPGGTFSGNGVSGNSFNPATLEGSTNISYAVLQFGCNNTSNQEVRVNPAPVISIENRVLSIDLGQTSEPFNVTVNPTEGVQFAWSPATGLSNTSIPNPTANPSESTRFMLTASVDGCSDTSSVLVVVSKGLVIPQAFTPNNDGENDTWVIAGLGAFANNKVMVFNRWGNIVFEVANYQNDWKASEVPTGTYFYMIDLGDEKQTGTLTILK